MYRGVAPGAYLLNLRVLGDDGSGTASDVIEAIDWSIDHRAEYNIRVINLSLGAPVLQPYRDDPVCAAVERAVRAGILVVAAAGNMGQTADGRRVLGGIVSPGNSPYAIDGGGAGHEGHGGAGGRRGGAVQLERADAVRPGAEAGPGGARAAGDVGGGGGEPAVGEFPGAPRGGERAELLHPGVGDEHGGGGGERCGGDADRGAAGPAAADDEGGAAADEHVPAGVGSDSGRVGEPERAGGGGVRAGRGFERHDDRGGGDVGEPDHDRAARAAGSGGG